MNYYIDLGKQRLKGPFKRYVMQCGGCQLSRKKRYEGVRFNVITESVSVGQISRRKALRNT